ncbi:conjugative transposon protein TraN [Dyadobacter subterraneus]|uniref:Conjugative transposon protein TraN n=1 Tax=Dyadobacter subterraneus TaxID=2773304 RepID=A0ABR9WCU7_9BACT|nr:conjugative transposon protein TraN [Dyadobacter subterraneus]MBE9462064.1 conjugative transposon protein TraN [Dyadobacter subterraneus]
MKNSLAKAAGLCLLAISSAASAQDVQLFSIAPFPIEITYNKTVNLIFPFAVKSVDKGSRDILAQKAKGVENILQLKAARKDFEQTNLTAITSDGKLYSFVVSYQQQPLRLNIELIQTDSRSSQTRALLSDQRNEAFLKNLASRAAIEQSHLYHIKDSAHKARLVLSGLYTADDVLFYRLSIDNRSNISYEIESLRFFISDKKQVKRAAAQQTEIIPLYVHDHTGKIQARQSSQLVFALPKFTTSDAKQLTIELMEKNGGRHLRLAVQNSTIVNAKPIL